MSAIIRREVNFDNDAELDIIAASLRRDKPRAVPIHVVVPPADAEKLSMPASQFLLVHQTVTVAHLMAWLSRRGRAQRRKNLSEIGCYVLVGNACLPRPQTTAKELDAAYGKPTGVNFVRITYCCEAVFG